MMIDRQAFSILELMESRSRISLIKHLKVCFSCCSWVQKQMTLELYFRIVV